MCTPRAKGWHRSCVPWTTRTGQEIADSVSATAAGSSPTKSADFSESITENGDPSTVGPGQDPAHDHPGGQARHRGQRAVRRGLDFTCKPYPRAPDGPPPRRRATRSQEPTRRRYVYKVASDVDAAQPTDPISKRSKPSEAERGGDQRVHLDRGRERQVQHRHLDQVHGRATGYEVLRATQVGAAPPATSAFRLVSATSPIASSTFEDHAATRRRPRVGRQPGEPAGHGLPRRHLGDHRSRASPSA